GGFSRCWRSSRASVGRGWWSGEPQARRACDPGRRLIRYTGARVKRVEDPRLLRGQGRFVDDIVLPRMLHAAFVRSPHAHAAVLRIDAARAHKVDGAVAVLGAAELGAGALPPRASRGRVTPTAWPV